MVLELETKSNKNETFFSINFFISFTFSSLFPSLPEMTFSSALISSQGQCFQSLRFSNKEI